MNALLIIGLVLVVLLGIIFFWGLLVKHSPVLCMVAFMLILAIAAALIITSSLPPKMESMQITYVNGNTISLFDGKGNTINMDISKIPRISTDYTVGMKVQLTRDTLGTPIFLSPQDWTILPRSLK